MLGSCFLLLRVARYANQRGAQQALLDAIAATYFVNHLVVVLDGELEIEAAGAGNLQPALKSFSLKSSGKGIVVLLSDFMDKGGYEEALRYLVARQFDVYVVQILAQEEIEPVLSGDLKLVDVEDGQLPLPLPP